MINYKPLEKIHQSEQGSLVIKVQNKDTDEICALKLIGQVNTDINRLIFKREIDALRILNQYDDIVKIYDSSDNLVFNKQSGYGAILLELIDGQPLNMVDSSKYSPLQKIVICRNCAIAINHAHQCSVLHRDIKPSNIMLVDDTSKIKIIDFGCSKLKTIVDDGTLKRVFSIGYIAPEVAQGHEATEKSDIYSLGAVFYYLFFHAAPESATLLTNRLQTSVIIPDVKSMLLEMLSEDPENRPDSMQDIVARLDKLIGCLNESSYTFWFTVDSEKLEKLKRDYTVEKSMTFQQFISVYLPDEFKTMYGSYNESKKTYEFIGNQQYMECTYSKEKRVFEIVKIYEIPIDKRNKLQRIFCNVEGQKRFSGFGSPVYGKNSNTTLEVQLHNHSDERKSFLAKSKLFDDLFGKWKDSITESFNNIKERNVHIRYDYYCFDGNRLSVNLTDTKGINIDRLESDMHFIFDGVEPNNKIKTVSIGCFEDVSFDDGKCTVSFLLDHGVSQKRLESFLQKKEIIIEDYRRKCVSLKRQLAAISALKHNEYSSNGLKDIILELAIPKSTQAIKSVKFINSKLNESQQQAVRNAIYSTSISLIQGPPGTGKTSVISEILLHVLEKTISAGHTTKILLVSQSNTAVDNALEGLLSWKASFPIRIVRIGEKKKVSKEVAEHFMIDAIKDSLFINAQTIAKEYVMEKIAQYEVHDSDDVVVRKSKESSYERWQSVYAIQEDWLKRCGDYDSVRYNIINSATIIAGTCVGFLADEYVRDMTFDYVVVDEAAKATTPELLVSIVKAKKIVLVGDQNQLPPFADRELSVLGAKLAKDPQYRLFDILFCHLPDTHKQLLNVQYRMHRSIGDLISKVFYNGEIITGVSNSERIHKLSEFSTSSIVWIDTSNTPNHGSRQEAGGSSLNLVEVRIIRNLLEKMNAQENARELDVGIITGYRAQKVEIVKSFDNGDYRNIGNVDINTLDAFQGRENDIIIYSTVRTSGSLGFQQEKERINVAFSRAKCLLIICGDINFFEKWSGDENKFVEIIQYIRINSSTCMIVDASEVLR